MRATLTMLTAAVLVLAATATRASGVFGPHPLACQPNHGRLIAADAGAEVYLTRGTRQFARFPAYLGCVRGGRWASFLGSPPFSNSRGAGGARHFTLAGPLVAREEFAKVARRPREQVWVVEVDDLRTGDALGVFPTGGSEPIVPGKRIGVGPTAGFVLQHDGAVAWIVRTSAADGLYQVRAAGRATGHGLATSSQVLASGPNIAPNSLALAGGTLYWTQGGKPMSAPLH
jgi:hypothetical protein